MISVISSFSDSTTGENTTTGYVKRLFVTFCDMSQKAFDITGYGPRPCGVFALLSGGQARVLRGSLCGMCPGYVWRAQNTGEHFGVTRT